MIAFIALGAGLAAAAVGGVAWAAGFGAVTERLRHVDGWWLLPAIGAEVLAYAGYVLAYRQVARVEGGPELPHRRALALVATGFGVFVARGGFAVDLHAFREEMRRRARCARPRSRPRRPRVCATRTSDLHRRDFAASRPRQHACFGPDDALGDRRPGGRGARSAGPEAPRAAAWPPWLAGSARAVARLDPLPAS